MNSSRIKILLVEDNCSDAQLVKLMLEKEPTGDITVHQAVTLTEALAMAEISEPDIVLLDLTLSDSKGMDTVVRMTQQVPSVPVVVLTATDSEENGIEAMRIGAQDYLTKGQITRTLLVRSIRHAMERHKLAQEIHNLSLVDELTGLYNRRGFLTLARQQIRIANQLQRPIFLLYADLDGMKLINDTYGHAEGDQAIVETGRQLQKVFQAGDIVGRIGGDEFVVLAIEHEEQKVQERVMQLYQNVQQLNACREHPFALSISVGMMPYCPQQPCTIDELLCCADAKMYEQKKAKKVARQQPTPRG